MTEPFRVKKPPQQSVFSIRLSDEHAEIIRRMAADSGVSNGTVIRQMVEHVIQQAEKEDDG